MNLLRVVFGESPRLFAIAIVAGTASGLCGAGLVKTISSAVEDQSQAGVGAVTFLLFCAGFLVTKSAAELSLLHLTQRSVYRLRIALSTALLRTPFRKLQSLGKAELLAIVTNDIGTLGVAFQMVPQVFSNTVTIVACLAYLAWLSMKIFLLFTMVLACGLVSYHFAEGRPHRLLGLARDRVEALYKGFRGLVEGAKELQLNRERGDRFVNEDITTSAYALWRANIAAMTGYTWVSNAGLIMCYLTVGLLLFVVPRWIPVAPPVLVAFTLILLFLIRPISEVMSMLPVVRQAGVAWDRIQQLEHDLAQDVLSSGASDPFLSSGPFELELIGVCHHYYRSNVEGAFQLGPINLRIAQGEIIFIVGGNGSGKTTLAMLLLGLYSPEEGAILLNGVRVDARNMQAYQQRFSAVFADFHLFETLLGPDASELEGKATRLIDDFGLSRQVSVVDGRFSTVDLSSGQRKRLALILSCLEDRPIYLFDEWAADQDPMFKRIFYTELLPQLRARGKTVLAITHDDAYFSQADRIVKLEDGQLRSMREKSGAPDDFGMRASAIP